MSQQHEYEVKVLQATNGTRNSHFSGINGKATYNSHATDKASLQCTTAKQALKEAFRNLNDSQKMELIFALEQVRLLSEMSMKPGHSLEHGVSLTLSLDPIGKACKQAGF